VVLISPKGPLYRHRSGIWKKSLRYQPLTLTTLAALIPDDVPVDLQLLDEGVSDVPLDLEADLIGLTVITGTAMRAYELADHFEELAKCNSSAALFLKATKLDDLLVQC